MSRTDDNLSPIAPLREPVFCMLRTTSRMAKVCIWMSDVAAAWMMTWATAKPLWVVLVKTASTLPQFLLCLPSGLLPERQDRRRFFIFIQLWAAAVVSILSIFIFLSAITLALRLRYPEAVGDAAQAASRKAFDSST